MSRSPTIIEDVWSSDPRDWLHNPHAGDMLALEFMKPLGLSSADLADRIGVSASSLDDIVTGRVHIDGKLDLRLARYFRMSDGFFLALQHRYEIVEAKRALNGALDQIVPRAA